MSSLRAASFLSALCLALAATTSLPALAVEWKGGNGPPPGFQRIEVLGVIPTEEGNLVILVDDDRENFLPLDVGLTEALSIHIRLERQRFARPLTHDLFDQVLSELDGRVVRVQIDDYRDDTFLGTVFIEARGKVHRFDARPSDAIALALGHSVPIYINRGVMQAHAVNVDELESEGMAEEAPVDENGDPIVQL